MFEIADEIEGETVHEMVVADSKEGVVVVTMTDVVQGGVKYEDIAFVQDFNSVMLH